MKVYYMNDEQKEITVRILDNNYSVTGVDQYYKLKPCEGRVFDLEIHEEAILYVKKWPGVVMLSYISLDALAQLEQQQQGQVTS